MTFIVELVQVCAICAEATAEPGRDCCAICELGQVCADCFQAHPEDGADSCATCVFGGEWE